MRDGDYPPVGNGERLRQYDTFHEGDQGDEDWMGYEFAETKAIRIVFIEDQTSKVSSDFAKIPGHQVWGVPV